MLRLRFNDFSRPLALYHWSTVITQTILDVARDLLHTAAPLIDDRGPRGGISVGNRAR
jgi:hypothetical protein